jgi:cellulose synthase/poly-beta-1,6-N-acetylglucosamine synthase-like glycosyltransferase
MYTIAVCIPTYKRPFLLKKLIVSILDSNINKSLIKKVNITVVDNDIDKTAEEIVKELSGETAGIYSMNYFNYPLKGLSNVRNELIRKARLSDPDFIVFIDDDEYVTAEWLNELIRVIVRNNAVMAIGPVVSVFDREISEYISCWFSRTDYADNTPIKYIRTGNLIIDAHSLLKYGIWFDNRFNRTGSEDTYFGIQMIKKGATVFWAANAIACEPVPEERTNLKWLIRRKYRGAITFTYMLKLEKEYLRLFKKSVVSLFYIISGICALVMLPFPVIKKYWGIIKISEGIGGMAGLANYKYFEYR